MSTTIGDVTGAGTVSVASTGYVDVVLFIWIYIYFELAECFKFFDLKSRIMTSIDTVPLDVDFGHLLTGSNYSERSRVGGGVGDFDDEGNNDRDNALGWGGTEYYYVRRCENTVDSTV